jgi:hypothetical protein
MTKIHLKLVAKIYAASMLIESDGGYDPEDVGLTESESEYLTKTLNQKGRKELGDHQHNSTLREIVTYVKNLHK